MTTPKPYVLVPLVATVEMAEQSSIVTYIPQLAAGGRITTWGSKRYQAMLAARPASYIALEEALEKSIAEIRAAFETVTIRDGVNCSDHALYNLEGAIIDIERTDKADKVSMQTLHRVAIQLVRIGQALTALAEAEAAINKGE